MSEEQFYTSPEEDMSEQQIMENMFCNLVVQQTRTALFALGQIPDPNSGQRILDLDTAQILIANLEMLEVKTKGNLSSKEEKLITESIEKLHDIFQHTIETLEKRHTEKQMSQENISESSSQTSPLVQSEPIVPPSESDKTVLSGNPSDNNDSRKRFSKKY